MTLLLTMFAVGIGVGSMLCARLLHGEVSARYVPFAAFGITLFTWDFAATVIGAGGLHLTSVAAILRSPTGWRHAGRSAAAVGLRRPLFRAALRDRAGAVGTVPPRAHDRGE